MSCIFIILCCRFPHTHLRVNPCESHVNPRSAEWIISMIFSLFRFWRMGAVTSTSSTLFIRFLYYNVQSLLGVIFDLVGIIFFLTDCSNFLLLFTQGYGEVSLSKHRVLFAQFLCTQYTELAWCESEIKFLFSYGLFSSVYFSFLMFGVQGVETSCKLCIVAFNFPKL